MRIHKRWATVALLILGTATRAPAHSMDQAAILLDFKGKVIDAELQLPAERLQSAIGTEHILNGLSARLPSGARFSTEPLDAPHLSHIEGAPYVVAHVRFLPPAGSLSEIFDLRCDLSPVVLVSIRTDWRTGTFANEPQLAGVLRGADRTARVDRRAGGWWNGFGSIFQLGMRHIAEGTDHLLFLLALLLPAPLLIARGQWSGPTDLRRCLLRIGKVVTAFTAGHSATLAVGALNLIPVPSRPIEVLVAASILVSSLHAIRPIFPGRESIVAGSFGLVHGMAFATTLAELGLSRWDRVASIFSFNLGIEAMQLLVVAATLPSLILLSRTRLYSLIRITGAVFAGAAAAAWIVQRIWGLPNPADAVVIAVAQRAIWIAGGLTLLGVFSRMSSTLRREGGFRVSENDQMMKEESIS